MTSPRFNAGSLAHLRLSNRVYLTVVLICSSSTSEDAERLPTFHVICGIFFWVTCSNCLWSTHSEIHTFVHPLPQSRYRTFPPPQKVPYALATTNQFSVHLGLAFSRMPYVWNRTLFNVLYPISFHCAWGVRDIPVLYWFVPFYCWVVSQCKCFFTHELNDIWVVCSSGRS